MQRQPCDLERERRTYITERQYTHIYIIEMRIFIYITERQYTHIYITERHALTYNNTYLYTREGGTFIHII
jgi:hypothetical protein